MLAASLALAATCFGAGTDLPTTPKTDAKPAAANSASSVASAKEAMDVPTSGPVELSMVTVAGVKIMWFNPGDWDVANGQPLAVFRPNYTLVLAGKFAGTVYNATRCRVEEAVTNTGEDLLEKKSQDFNLFLYRRDENYVKRKGLVFTAELSLPIPRKQATSIGELSGKVLYTVVGKSKMVNLGLTEFKAGAKGTAFGAEIESINNPNMGDEKNLTLIVSNLPGAFGEFKFYDEGGATLVVQPSCSMSDDYSGTFSFNRKEGFPAKGRIEIEVYDDVKQFEAPFKLKDIPLVGKPAKPKA
jgi:hypothetical protein